MLIDLVVSQCPVLYDNNFEFIFYLRLALHIVFFCEICFRVIIVSTSLLMLQITEWDWIGFTGF